MKKFTKLKNLMILICLAFLGINNSEAQCTLTAFSSVGANGVASFTSMPTPYNGTTMFGWYFPGSTTPTGPSGNGAFNATATYTANGTYTVYATMYNTAPSCSNSVLMVVTITNVAVPAPVCTLNVVYSGATNSVTCNGSASVTAPSNMCGAVSYTWSNGTTGPVANGLCPGTNYTVLASSVSGVNCCTLSSGVVNVNAGPMCNLIANFNWSSSANGLVNFNNTSVGATGGATYTWNFGDGTSASGPSPVHTYSANGFYSATLTVNNNVFPACTSTKVLSVLVNTYCNLVAGFNISNITTNTKQFNNTSTGALGAPVSSWNYGDGSTGGGFSPVHTYTATGMYSVTLIVSSSSLSSCADTAVSVVNISTICVASANFTLAPSGTPQVWNAYPTAPLNITNAVWYWGDGTQTNTLYTSHTYSAAGNYSICLTVTASCGSTAIFCSGYNIFRSSNGNSMVTINVLDPSAPTDIKTNGSAGNLDYNIYPNPSNGHFRLNLNGLPTGMVKVSVYDVIGELVYNAQSETQGSFSKEIQLNSAAGVYFIQVNAQDKTLTKKIVVNK